MEKPNELLGQLNRNKRKSPLIFTLHFYSIVNGKRLKNHQVYYSYSNLVLT